MKRHLLIFTAIALLTVFAAAYSKPISQKGQSGITEYGTFELIGKGTQTYQCKPNPKTDAAEKFTWQAPTPAQPKAKLFDSKGKQVGTHYTGPTWESDADYSKVVGSVQTQGPAPKLDPKEPDANIPWVFLDVKSKAGNGMFSNVKRILRVNTEHGLAPKGTCDPKAAPMEVDYVATYIFLTDKK